MGLERGAAGGPAAEENYYLTHLGVSALLAPGSGCDAVNALFKFNGGHSQGSGIRTHPGFCISNQHT